MSEEKASYDPRPSNERQNIHVNKKINVPSVNDLEQLSTHELADLLSQVVLLLRRMPDVPMSDVTSHPGNTNGHEAEKDHSALAAKVRRTPKQAGQAEMPDWLE